MTEKEGKGASAWTVSTMVLAVLKFTVLPNLTWKHVSIPILIEIVLKTTIFVVVILWEQIDNFSESPRNNEEYLEDMRNWNKKQEKHI